MTPLRVILASQSPRRRELLTLVGYYALLALQLRVFRVPLPEGVDHTFT